MNISIVVPAFNEASLLPRTLASIRALTRKPDEIIVVNNGSTDNTQQVAKSIGVKTVMCAKKGIACARQKGLETASGDIVVYTDADTIVPGAWLTKIEKAFVHSDVVGIFGDYVLSDDNWLLQKYTAYLQPVIWMAFSRIGFPMAAGCNFAIKRKTALAVGGFPVTYTFLEENEIAKRLLSKGRVVYLPKNSVVTSGRRSQEGIKYPIRYIFTFIYWMLFRKHIKRIQIGFNDFRVL